MVFAILAVVGYAFLARFVLHGPVDGASLARSLSEATGSGDELLGGDLQDCRPAGQQRWRCVVLDSQASGGVEYAVVVRDGSSCWDARRTAGPRFGLPERVDGCVHRWQWTLLDA